MDRGVARVPIAGAVLALLLALFMPQWTAGGLGSPAAQAATPRQQVRIPDVSKGARAVVPRIVTPRPDDRLAFGVYPGGGTGETPDRAKPSGEIVLQRLRQLSGGRPLVVHLYTAWSWHGDWLDAEIERYTRAGHDVVLTVKYSPPAGHEGDVAGYEAFVRSIVRKYAANPRLVSLCIGNEANVYGNPDASDGPFKSSHLAVARGVVAAGREVAAMGSATRVGFNFVVNADQASDAAFLQELTSLGGPEFAAAAKIVGLQVYPGVWYPGSSPYADMTAALTSGRASVDSVPSLRGRPIEVLETGAPILDENEQAARLDAFTRATLDNRARLNIVHFNWFDLWDADSSSASQFGHYGLLRSDMTEKPAFDLYRSVIAARG